MTRTLRSTPALVFVILFLFSSFGSGRAFDERKKAPNFSLKTADGLVVELQKLRGKVVVINFWATWCGPCRAEIPGFVDVYERYKSKGLEVIGISVDNGGWTDVQPFVKRYGIPYPIVLDDGKTVRRYGNIAAIPTTFIIDQKGFIVERHIGSIPRDEFEAMVKGLLGQ
ncbi:MAG TPA: TlpA disulfide reductase family protein [Bacteroidota bacterium]|nr:TlpA disulfide reductase family protein [Bacteroidota bacterium]